MKIIQTLRVGDKPLLTDAFGWRSAQDHVMGWVFSCMQLRKYYDEVELYTDAAGYELLITQLKLPYTKVHVGFDELRAYKPELWALSKLKVYSVQEAPFIHVDGDVFIWKAFPGEWEQAELIAQNKERGTSYYGDITKHLLAGLVYVPEQLDLNVTAMDICSCNAGILGGSNLAFFKQYAALAFDMVEKNKDAPLQFRELTNFNLVFEQMLFWQLANREDIPVSCQLDVHNDFEYHFVSIGDFSVLPYTNGYIHLLGEHKRNAMACDMVHRYVLAYYPDYYFAVKRLFDDNLYVQTTTMITDPSQEIVAIDDLRQFNVLVDEVKERRNTITIDNWISREAACLDSLGHFLIPDEQLPELVLVRDPHVSIVKLMNNLAKDVKTLIGKVREVDAFVAISPELVGSSCQQLYLDTLDCLILCTLDEAISFQQLLEEMKAYFPETEIAAQYATFRDIILKKVNMLCVYKCVKVSLPEILNS